MKAQPEVIELDIRKLEALLARIEAALGKEVAGPFRELLHGYQQFLKMLENKVPQQNSWVDLSARTT